MRKLLFILCLIPVALNAQIRPGVVASAAHATGSSAVQVTSITVHSSTGATTISTNGGTLQMTTKVLPTNATDTTVVWSETEGTGHATVGSSGLMTAVSNGTATARATAHDGSGVYGYKQITISNQSASSTLLTGLLAYYKLDETTGSIAFDATSHHYDLTNTGATMNVTGKIGTSFSYNGTTNKTGGIDGTFELQTMTVSCWVYTAQTGETSGIVDNYHWTGDGWSIEIGGEWDNDGLAVFHLNDETNELNLYKTSGTAINNSAWHHLVGVFNGSTAYLYVDHVLETSAAWAHTITYNASNVFKLGCRGGDDGELFFAGRIDEVGIWNRAMAQSGIDSLWNSGNGRTHPF
jgi:hypothetical protein